MQTVSPANVVTSSEVVEEPLPPRIQEALAQLVGAAKEGLLALCVGVGPGVLEELMAEEVDEVCGPRASTTPIESRTGMGAMTGRSRSAGAACRSSGRGCAPRMVRARCRSAPMSTSPGAISARGSFWSGCSRA
jgi:hypothetical protein